MESSATQYEFKLKKLLNKFLEPGYRLGNDVYLNILLSHLSGKHNEAQAEELKRLPVFVEWLETAVTQWETSMNLPSASIATFTLNLVSLVSVNEISFIKLNCANVYVRICKVLKLRSKDLVPSVKLGYLKMLHSFMSHKSGLDWLVATDHWNDILLYCLETQTIYITRDGYNFMFDLLSKFIEVHPTFCELIVKKLLSPLDTDNCLNGTFRAEIDDVQIQKELMPTLKLVAFIIEKSFMSNSKSDNVKIPDVFLNKYDLESTLWKLLLVARDSDFLFHISKPLYCISFLAIDPQKLQASETFLPVILEFSKKFFRLFNTFISKEDCVCVLKLCLLGHNYWRKINVKLPLPENKEALLFENQLIIFQILPILCIALNTRKLAASQDELTEMFIHKLTKISCEHTIRCAYSFRNLIMSSPVVNCFDVAQKAIFYLMKTRQQLHRDRAVIVFQALVHALKYLCMAVTDKSQFTIDLMTYHTGFLSALLDGLSSLIKDFKITWRESVETICLTALSLEFLNFPNLPTKLTVQGLQLMHLTIANFMPPNLALLVDEISDSSITAITPMLYKRLHDPSWEIRDSALEILQTVVDIGHLKFPAFQKMVVDDHLCQLAVVLSTEDSEGFVRASAIKCLTAMIKVPMFWVDCLEYEQLPEKMMAILQNETEAIVRCEAAKLVCEIYEHQYIPQDIISTVYTSMGAAVTNDLHWEVKVNALTFWDKVINNEMTNQGMIDGAFPSVTFSKENKKIVTLTEPEIQARLNKVLINLSECGCLGVLLAAVRDDCDLQVAKRAVEITKKFTELLRKYNSLLSSSSELPSDMNRSCWDTFNNLKPSYSRETDVEMADNIIDSIVSSSDMNLLGSVYREGVSSSQMNGDVVKSLKIVKPDVFKSFVIKDLDGLIDGRSEWMEKSEDLNSLLDDILQSYEDNDVNSMDCY